ncbi:dolichol monophosphate mannose synthase [Pacificimonas flava]|uniref:Dolichol monophosphate mannose synthase n=2 Tax=Pacificimonas TaxID=1960290 RepID=A0A219B8H2_9SPHN|nr:glycosyltransferase family 2 protein [Pacificimonas aurantium]OWV34581.1 dolichol monophosphate mannose synthase [Pacificimonas flava]
METFRHVENRPLELAVVVPVLNEHDNVGPLLEKLSIALAGIEFEVIFVDDGSGDGTPERVEAIAATDRRVRLLRRIGRRGLSSAVVEGFLSTVAQVVAVIDGDLQHDETVLPGLYRAIAEDGYELAVGTRYAEGGGTGDWDRARERISRLATRLAAPVTKTLLSDPMSGFFAAKRAVVLEAASDLSSVGYKILLDLVASHPRRLTLKEVPYEFRSRTAGESKLDSAVALEYFELLLDKLVGRFVPVKFLMFGAVGALGLLVHLCVLGVALNAAGLGFAAAQTLAVLTAMTFNYALNNAFTYRDRRLSGFAWWRGLASFALVCSAGAAANVGVAGFVFGEQGADWWLAGALGALVGAIWNYAVTSWLTWSRR